MDPCDCSKCKFSVHVFVFSSSLPGLNFKNALFSSWKLQLRRILHLHELCLHHMQEKYVLQCISGLIKLLLYSGYLVLFLINKYHIYIYITPNTVLPVSST